MIICSLARTAAAYVRPRCWHSRVSNAGLAMLYSMNFISTNPLCETIGNAERNAAWSPSGFRFCGGTSFCRKATYESFCIVSR